MALERRVASRRHDAALGGSAEGDALARLRRSVLASLEGAPVSGVRLELHPGKPPVIASVHLTGDGPSAAIIELSGHLVRPGSGLVLGHVRFTPSRAGLLLDVDGLSLEASP